MTLLALFLRNPSEEEPVHVKIGVGVGKGSSGEYALKWTLENQIPPSNTIHLIHVYPPLRLVPTPTAGNKVPISEVNDSIVKKFQEERFKETEKLLDKYRSLCQNKKVVAEVCYVVGESVQQELVDQIFKLGLTKLVLGTSTNTVFSRAFKGETIPKSVAKRAPQFCTVFVVCKGRLCSVKDATETLITPALSDIASSEEDSIKDFDSSISSSVVQHTSDMNMRQSFSFQNTHITASLTDQNYPLPALARDQTTAVKSRTSNDSVLSEEKPYAGAVVNASSIVHGQPLSMDTVHKGSSNRSPVTSKGSINERPAEPESEFMPEIVVSSSQPMSTSPSVNSSSTPTSVRQGYPTHTSSNVGDDGHSYKAEDVPKVSSVIPLQNQPDEAKLSAFRGQKAAKQQANAVSHTEHIIQNAQSDIASSKEHSIKDLESTKSSTVVKHRSDVYMGQSSFQNANTTAIPAEQNFPLPLLARDQTISVKSPTRNDSVLSEEKYTPYAAGNESPITHGGPYMSMDTVDIGSSNRSPVTSRGSINERPAEELSPEIAVSSSQLMSASLSINSSSGIPTSVRQGYTTHPTSNVGNDGHEYESEDVPKDSSVIPLHNQLQETKLSTIRAQIEVEQQVNIVNRTDNITEHTIKNAQSEIASSKQDSIKDFESSKSSSVVQRSDVYMRQSSIFQITNTTSSPAQQNSPLATAQITAVKSTTRNDSVLAENNYTPYVAAAGNASPIMHGQPCMSMDTLDMGTYSRSPETSRGGINERPAEVSMMSEIAISTSQPVSASSSVNSSSSTPINVRHLGYANSTHPISNVGDDEHKYEAEVVPKDSSAIFLQNQFDQGTLSVIRANIEAEQQANFMNHTEHIIKNASSDIASSEDDSIKDFQSSRCSTVVQRSDTYMRQSSFFQITNTIAGPAQQNGKLPSVPRDQTTAVKSRTSNDSVLYNDYQHPFFQITNTTASPAQQNFPLPSVPRDQTTAVKSQTSNESVLSKNYTPSVAAIGNASPIMHGQPWMSMDTVDSGSYDRSLLTSREIINERTAEEFMPEIVVSSSQPMFAPSVNSSSTPTWMSMDTVDLGSYDRSLLTSREIINERTAEEFKPEIVVSSSQPMFAPSVNSSSTPTWMSMDTVDLGSYDRSLLTSREIINERTAMPEIVVSSSQPIFAPSVNSSSTPTWMSMDTVDLGSYDRSLLTSREIINERTAMPETVVSSSQPMFAPSVNSSSTPTWMSMDTVDLGSYDRSLLTSREIINERTAMPEIVVSSSQPIFAPSVNSSSTPTWMSMDTVDLGSYDRSLLTSREIINERTAMPETVVSSSQPMFAPSVNSSSTPTSIDQRYITHPNLNVGDEGHKYESEDVPKVSSVKPLQNQLYEAKLSAIQAQLEQEHQLNVINRTDHVIDNDQSDIASSEEDSITDFESSRSQHTNNKYMRQSSFFQNVHTTANPAQQNCPLPSLARAQTTAGKSRTRNDSVLPENNYTPYVAAAAKASPIMHGQPWKSMDTVDMGSYSRSSVTSRGSITERHTEEFLPEITVSSSQPMSASPSVNSISTQTSVRQVYSTHPGSNVGDGHEYEEEDMPRDSSAIFLQNHLEEAKLSAIRAQIEAEQQVNALSRTEHIVENAKKMIVEKERQRDEALREADMARYRSLEDSRKLEEVVAQLETALSEQERLRKEIAEEAARHQETRQRVNEYKSSLDSANRRAEEERKKCEEALTRLAAVLEELGVESRLRTEAEARARKETAAKQGAIAALRKLQRKYTVYTYEELSNATDNFSEHNKLGEGGYGPVYKGELQHTTVAIKVLAQDGARGREEFEREVEILSSLRHPHMVMLLGACPQKACIVYEYLSHGSLEDRLRRRGGSPPLPWYVRFRICAEVAIALLFLHSRQEPIVHRDLKPGNILLDRNYVSKIGDVGLAKLVPDSVTSSVAMYKETVLAGTMAYMDPDYQRTGVVSCESDVYALGIVMLQLLTGKQAFGVADLVEKAIANGHLNAILDRSAGDWPIEKTTELAVLALDCAEPRRRHRPKLETKILPHLETLRACAYEAQLAAVASALQSSEIIVPGFLFCPISQEIMQNPHIAADGYTYDYETISIWLKNHETSPMTNLKLDHKNLIPNHAVQSAIKDWLDKRIIQ